MWGLWNDYFQFNLTEKTLPLALEHFRKVREKICATAQVTRGLVTPLESDAQGGEELGAEINLISASDSLPIKNPPLLRQSLRIERLQIRFKLFPKAHPWS